MIIYSFSLMDHMPRVSEEYLVQIWYYQKNDFYYRLIKCEYGTCSNQT